MRNYLFRLLVTLVFFIGTPLAIGLVCWLIIMFISWNYIHQILNGVLLEYTW